MTMYATLNPAQLDAVRYQESPLLVLAGAGSGKTRVITAKIAHLVETGTDPAKILAITFTNKAAEEMRERVKSLLKQRGHGDAYDKITVSTFHSLGLSILRHEREALGLKPRFSIFDPLDLETVISDLSGHVGNAKPLQWQISQWKNALVAPELALKEAKDDEALIAARAYVKYADALQAYQAVDLDDLITRPVKLFAENEAAYARWCSRYSHVLIDEYQDTNPAQYALLKTLVADNPFTAVGDDDQAIYGWRGATLENLKQLPAEYPNLKVIKLEQNYRSCVRILRSANALIQNNEKLFEKKLWSDLGLGETIAVTPAANEDGEAELVVRRLLAHKFQHRTNFSDYAILYRGNFQARPFENALRAQQVPYLLSGGQSFFERAEIKDLMAYLRLIANDNDDPSFIRAITTPRRGVGQTTLAHLGTVGAARHESLFAAAFAHEFEVEATPKARDAVHGFCHMINSFRYRAEREPAGRLLDELLHTTGYADWILTSFEKRDAEKRMNNVRDFIAWLTKKAEADEKNLLDLTQMLVLISMMSEDGETADCVRLSTLHASKGLEFPHVYLVGVEEGILPHRESIDGDKVDEERRLMYVGITRAQRTLSLSYCEQRKRAGEKSAVKPSRFIKEMAQDDLRFAGVETPDTPEKRQAGAERMKALRSMIGKRNVGN
jgi:ATP-dependent DNA helicase Rep